MAETDAVRRPSNVTQQPATGAPREFYIRILSALVLAPLAVAAAYVDGWLFTLFWGLAAAGILWEWIMLVAGQAARAALVIGGSALAAALMAIGTGRPGTAVAIIAGGAALSAVIARNGRAAWYSAGIGYAGAALILPVVLRTDAELGFVAIVFLFAVVWATDICAYFAGRALGGAKLAVRLSPNKTWSGAFGGAAAAVAAGLIVAAAAGLDQLLMIGVVSLALSIVAQMGDLLESAIKRAFGAKDASRLIPGHGGLMDRLDGFLAACLLAAAIGVSRGGLDSPAHGLLVW